RERMTLDRAVLLAGTPEATSAIERAHASRGTSDTWWKKYLDLPRGAEEDRLAQDTSAKRDALHRELDAFAADIAANKPATFVDDARRLQTAYNDLGTADDALSQFQFNSAKHGYDAAQASFDVFRLISTRSEERR